MKLAISERQQLVLILLAAAAVLFSLWFFLLTPLNRRRYRLEREIGAMSDRLMRDNYLQGEEALRAQKQSEERLNRELQEWGGKVFARLAAGQEDAGATNTPVGHIDFKVTLIEVQQQLRKTADRLGIAMPYDLGVDDTLRGNEDARTRILQLRTEARLLDMILNLKVGMIRSIEPLPPYPYRSKNGEVYGEEYPVQICFQGSMGSVYELFSQVLEERHPFVFRQLRIQKVPGTSDRVEVNAVMSALVFQKSAGEILPSPVVVPIGPVAPRGY